MQNRSDAALCRIDTTADTSDEGAPGLTRREFLALGLAAGLSSGSAWGQEFPSRPIRLMVASTPGGGVDITARLIAVPVGEELKTAIVVDNKPGANGLICGDYVAKSPPDGYTIMFAAGSQVSIAPQMVSSPPFNALTDLAPVATIGASPIALVVGAGTGIRTLQDFMAQARARPLKLASSGLGSLSHLIIELLSQATGDKILHVPYKGAGAALTDVVAGHVDGAISDVSTFTPYFKDRLLIPIAVASDQRLELLPEVPTMKDALNGFTAYSWYGIFAPAKTPRVIVEKLGAAFVKAANRDDIAAQLKKQAVIQLSYRTPDAFAKFVAAEYTRWGKIVKDKKLSMP